VIQIDDIVEVNEDILTTEIDDEIGMMNIEQGLYYTLNHIGKKIWSLLCNKIMVDELIDKLMCEFDVDYHECKRDVLELLNLLDRNDLIKVVGS